MYAYNDAYLYLPHDLRAIFNTQYFHETCFIADSHRIMFYDLLNKVKNEDHDGYIIANDDEFLAKITLKENKIVVEAEAEAEAVLKVEAAVEGQEAKPTFIRLEELKDAVAAHRDYVKHF